MIYHREQRRFYGAMICYYIYISITFFGVASTIAVITFMLLVNDNVFEWRYPSPFAKADVTFDGGQRNMLPSCFNPNLLGLVMFMPNYSEYNGGVNQKELNIIRAHICIYICCDFHTCCSP